MVDVYYRYIKHRELVTCVDKCAILMLARTDVDEVYEGTIRKMRGSDKYFLLERHDDLKPSLVIDSNCGIWVKCESPIKEDAGVA